jgi:stage V sporulation protein AB
MSVAALFVAFAQGIVVAAGTAVFISLLGIVPQLATVTGTTQNIKYYAYALFLGIFVGALFNLLPVRGNPGIAGQIGLALIELFWGIFLGVLLSALAELFNVLPSVLTQLQLSKTLRILIVALMLGKVTGILAYWLTPFFK